MDFVCFLSVICAAGGQQEEHLVLRSPVKDVVNKNSTEPQAAQTTLLYYTVWGVASFVFQYFISNEFLLVYQEVYKYQRMKKTKRMSYDSDRMFIPQHKQL